VISPVVIVPCWIQATDSVTSSATTPLLSPKKQIDGVTVCGEAGAVAGNGQIEHIRGS